MKSDSFKKNKDKIFKVKRFDGGLNLSPESEKSDNIITQMSNLLYESGCLKTRQGLTSDKDSVIGTYKSDGDNTYSYVIKDSCLYLKGTQYQIGYVKHFYDDAHYTIYIFFISSDGKISNGGRMDFLRTSYNIFYRPESIVFYSGTPNEGSGIYALVTLQNQYNLSEHYYNVYEITKELDAWKAIGDFYTPTIYINGRGTQYEKALASDQAYTGKPTELEELNMLSGRFKAYFTSDGFSSCFRLPITELTKERIVCRVYTTLKNYTEWVIDENENTASQQFFSASVILTVDREKGSFYFTVNGEEQPIPIMSQYHENNICFTAYKTISDDFGKIVSSRVTQNVANKIIVAGGDEYCRAYITSYDNPLYFSKKASALIGDANDSIIALKPVKNNVIAFKQSSIYQLSFTDGKEFSTNNLLMDSNRIFYQSDSIKGIAICETKGCNNAATIEIIGNCPVFLSTDGCICALKSLSTGEITIVSSPIASLLETFTKDEMEKAFSACNNNFYLLMIGAKTIIMDFAHEKTVYSHNGFSASNSTIKFYEWILPLQLDYEGATSIGGEIRLCCVNKDDGTTYLAKFGADQDNIYSMSTHELSETGHDIEAYFSTRFFDFGDYTAKKNILAVTFTAKSNENISVTLKCSKDRFYKSIRMKDGVYNDNLKTVCIRPSLHGENCLAVVVTGKKGFEFGELSIEYTSID